MSDKRSIKSSLLSAIVILILFFTGFHATAQDGKALFSANCASCHNPHKVVVGPALAGLQDRGPWSDKKQLYAWVHNPAGFMKTNSYTADLFKQYNGVLMTSFPQFSDKEIDAIVSYINSVPTPGASGNGGGSINPSETAAEEGDSTLLYGVLTLILAIVAFTLATINSNLKKLTDDKKGLGSVEPVPFYRNKVYIAFIIVLLFLAGGYFTVKGAIGLGRTKDYTPEQPIFYSHKVHAGANQINCMYCHIGTYQGKQATIPSVNICMNCHMAINEYKGDKIYNADGKEIDGTAEIQKLYKYANFTPGKNSANWDAGNAKPVEWVRIHNLPDHVYFNHQQHVVAGKVQCQTCHGEIQKMDEVHQFADLSMGWCINCHRETKVQFKDNGFYSIYEQFHKDMESGKIDTIKGITVEKIGGTECQKCHY